MFDQDFLLIIHEANENNLLNNSSQLPDILKIGFHSPKLYYGNWKELRELTATIICQYSLTIN